MERSTPTLSDHRAFNEQRRVYTRFMLTFCKQAFCKQVVISTTAFSLSLSDPSAVSASNDFFTAVVGQRN